MQWCVFVLLVVSSLRSNSAYVKIHSFVCFPNPELCNDMTCSNRISPSNLQTLSVSCVLPRPMHNITGDIKLQKETDGKFKTFANGRGNMCNALKHMLSSSPLIKVFDYARPYLNNFKCPFVGNVSAVDVPIGVSLKKGFRLTSTYRVLFNLYEQDELVLATALYFSSGRKSSRGASLE